MLNSFKYLNHAAGVYEILFKVESRADIINEQMYHHSSMCLCIVHSDVLQESFCCSVIVSSVNVS